MTSSGIESLVSSYSASFFGDVAIFTFLAVTFAYSCKLAFLAFNLSNFSDNASFSLRAVASFSSSNLFFVLRESTPFSRVWILACFYLASGSVLRLLFPNLLLFYFSLALSNCNLFVILRSISCSFLVSIWNFFIIARSCF